MRQIGGCPDGAGVYSIIYIRQDGGCLLGVYSVSYTRQVGGCLQQMCNLSGTCDTWVIVCGMCVLCYLHEADLRLSVGNVHSLTYMRQIDGCLQGVCTLSVT